jgi:hypothetical protein
LKCGGGKELTKPIADDVALKYPLAVEEPKKLEATALVVCDTQANPELECELEVVPVRTEIKSKNSILGKIMPELYDLENGVVKEKPVKIELDLDLYQMEKV